jgi:hypothetical protein
MDFEQPTLEICDCKNKYSIEPHGIGYALYMGRCDHKHGLNLALLTEISNNCELERIVELLNMPEK